MEMEDLQESIGRQLLICPGHTLRNSSLAYALQYPVMLKIRRHVHPYYMAFFPKNAGWDIRRSSNRT